LPRCKQAITSIAERKDMPKNLLNSGVDCPVEPSAIFNAIESAALLICGDKTYSSLFGKEKLIHLFLCTYI
jgi:hypothetical protein